MALRCGPIALIIISKSTRHDNDRKPVDTGTDEDRLVSRTLSLINGLRPSAAGDEHDPSRRTVTILGERGQGKSTLLRQVRKHLESQRAVVLPTADPEFFHSSDDLLTWSLAGLESAVPAEVLDAGGDAAVTLRKRIQDTRRDHLLVASDVSSGLLSRGVAPLEYARDASILTPTGMSLVSKWQTLMDEVASKLTDRDLLIVLPVDDADLHPSKLTEFLAQIQLLGTSRHFVTLLAADEVSLLNCLRAGEINEYKQWERLIGLGMAKPANLSDVAARKFTKYFPRQNRVRIPGVALEGRLEFSPTGSEVSLGDLLARFPIPGNGRTLRSIFEVHTDTGERVMGTEYAHALSGNRRDLEQLHRALEYVADEDLSTQAAIETILFHGLESVRYDLAPELWDSLRLVDINGVTELILDFTQIGFGKIVGGRARIYSSSDSRPGGPTMSVSVRRISNFYSFLRPTTDDGTPELVAPPMFTALVDLAWEAGQEDVSGNTLVKIQSVLGTFANPGLRNWSGTLNVSANPATYLTPPDWEEFSDYFSYCCGWNKLVEAAFPIEPQQRKSLLLDEVFIVAHLELVTSIQFTRTIPKWIADLDSETLQAIASTERWENAYTDKIRKIGERISEVLNGATNQFSSNQRMLDFRAWIDIGLPLATTRNICSQRLAEDVRQLWSQYSRSGGAGGSVLSEHLAAEISEYIENEQADADIDLLQLVDFERGAAVRRVRETVGGRRDEDRRQLIVRLRETVTDAAVVDRLESDGAAPEVLTALRLLGVPAAALPQIAEIFPPRGGSGADHDVFQQSL